MRIDIDKPMASILNFDPDWPWTGRNFLDR